MFPPLHLFGMIYISEISVNSVRNKERPLQCLADKVPFENYQKILDVRYDGSDP